MPGTEPGGGGGEREREKGTCVKEAKNQKSPGLASAIGERKRLGIVTHSVTLGGTEPPKLPLVVFAVAGCRLRLDRALAPSLANIEGAPCWKTSSGRILPTTARKKSEPSLPSPAF